MKKFAWTYLAVFVIFIGLMWVIAMKGRDLVAAYGSLPGNIVPGKGAAHGATNLGLLLMQVLVILLAARLMGYLAKKVRLPVVVGEMIAGILLGPSLLGWLAPNVSAFVFPPASLPTLSFISQIGLILFMFVIGMELDTSRMRHKARAAVVISHASILFPYFLGMTLAYFLFEKFAYTGTPFLSFALFMGIAMSITAFPVLARILQERKLTQTPVGALAITCAAADDVTAWCILAMVIAIVKAGDLTGALLTIVYSLAFVLLLLYPVKKWIAGRMEQLLGKKDGATRIIALSFLVMISSAWLSETIGIHALFGAFLAGVIMPRDARFQELLAGKVEDLSVLLLLPIFFAFTGLRTQIGLLGEGHYWWICGLIILVAVAGKFGGSMIAARLVGQDWRSSFEIGALMNTRGLMELIVLNIGFDLGILSPEIFAMLVIMAISTTLMTGPALDLINRYWEPRSAATPVHLPTNGGS
ncbi:cation:proton antiporter [Flavihumibacter petaseus]|uniref:Putative CPA2 family transporter n=1 Tax=Flavihumibacter petaseus NBRC 106054 TaxID=1220578 RepID=A0A0E9MXP9_9BACT|nr:cation:proton antiporter [Flavihumibacter petaseus]GAO42364.1 putative CPA2 family transporter [Flavihumibacter petaseus NBRC 106054]